METRKPCDVRKCRKNDAVDRKNFWKYLGISVVIAAAIYGMSMLGFWYIDFVTNINVNWWAFHLIQIIVSVGIIVLFGIAVNLAYPKAFEDM